MFSEDDLALEVEVGVENHVGPINIPFYASVAESAICKSKQYIIRSIHLIASPAQAKWLTHF